MKRRELLSVLGQLGLLPLVSACSELLPDAKSSGGKALFSVKVGTLDQLNQNGKYLLTTVATSASPSYPVVVVAVSSPSAPANSVAHPTVAGLFLLAFSRVCTHQGTTIDAPANGQMYCSNHGQLYDCKTGAPTGSANKTNLPLTLYTLKILNTNEVWIPGSSGGPDTTAPTVSLQASNANLTAAGSIDLTVTASDNSGVSKVEVYEGTNLLTTLDTAPYLYSVTFAMADNGTHSYTAKAYDAAGNVGTSTAVTVTVNIAPPAADTKPPTISLASSSSNVTAAGSITLTATATDNVGVTKVEFYEGTNLLGSTAAAPFTTSISYDNSKNGTHSYSAKAYDAAGNVGTSSAVSVVVNIPKSTGDTTPPMISLASSSSNVTSAGSITLTATATDNVGVAKVEIFEGTTLLATKTAAPYTQSITFDATKNGAHSYSAKAYDAAGNVTTSNIVAVTVNITAVTGQKVATLADFPTSSSFKRLSNVTIAGKVWNIIILRTANGQPSCGGASSGGVNLVAYSANCTHKGTLVQDPGVGGTKAGSLFCDNHGAEFNPTNCAAVLVYPNNNPTTNIPALPSFVLTIDASGNVYLPK